MTYISPRQLVREIERLEDIKTASKARRKRAMENTNEWMRAEHVYIFGYQTVRYDQRRKVAPKVITIGSPIRMTGIEALRRNKELERKFMNSKNMDTAKLWRWFVKENLEIDYEDRFVPDPVIK